METVTPGLVESWAVLASKHGLPIIVSVVGLLIVLAFVGFILAMLRSDRKRNADREDLLAAQLEEQHEKLWAYFTTGDGNVSARLADLSTKLDSIRAMMLQLQATVDEHGQRLGQGDFRFGELEERLARFEAKLLEIKCLQDADCPKASPRPRKVPQ